MASHKKSDQESPLMTALRYFESTEANLTKLERVWREIETLTPQGIVFGTTPEYEGKCRAFEDIKSYLPAIDGWKVTAKPMGLDEIAQGRFDAEEIGEVSTAVAVEEGVDLPGKELGEYRYRFNKQRRELIRSALTALIDLVDADVRDVQKRLKRGVTFEKSTIQLESKLSQIDTLLGSSIPRPERWSDMQRHLSFAEPHDFNDIVKMDWPSIKSGLQQAVYEVDEPIHVGIEDLTELTRTKPEGAVSRELNWKKLDSERFERLLFSLISTSDGYENPQWLTATNAPDKGRDLSVNRVMRDRLTGTIRHRIIIQCKHWLSRSVSPRDIATLREQIKLWEPPRIDVVIIATSGRFTADAVATIEKHNQSDSGLRIEMWPESHLETLLASNPHLIAEFGLR